MTSMPNNPELTMYWTEVVATACYTQNKSTIVKRHLKTPYEIFHGRIPNIDFLYVFGCQVYIHNHKDYLGKFDEKADDDYLLGYSLVSKTFKVFNTRKNQTIETYPFTLDECHDASKFTNSDHSNHNNDDSIIDNLINTKDVQNHEPTSSPTENTSVPNTIPIPIVPSSSIPSMTSPVPQDRSS
ncbi:retrovirus-related pol polyprotein from transposon TNT 1-94 [Tanacetum coccineum]